MNPTHPSNQSLQTHSDKGGLTIDNPVIAPAQVSGVIGRYSLPSARYRELTVHSLPPNLPHHSARAVFAAAAVVLATLASITQSRAAEPAATFGAAAPLAPTEAFVPVAAIDAGGSLQIDWDIADGYYLYRDKLSVAMPGAPGIDVGELRHSDALIVADDFFGEQATFRDSATTRAALLGLPADGGALRVAVTFQGCADIGLCYPPTTTDLDVDIPTQYRNEVANVSSAVPSGQRSALDSLFGGSNRAEPDLLPPQDAFRPALVATTTTALTLDWHIETDYYLYRDKLHFDLLRADGTLIPDIAISARPDGVLQEDAFFGETAIHRDSARYELAFGSNALDAGEEATLRLHYQGCADIGVCFPPGTMELPFIATDVVSATSTVSSIDTTSDVAPAARSATGGSALGSNEQDRLSSMLASSNLWLSVATFFGLGILLAFTPCVLPMVPILSSLIVGQRSAEGEGIGGAQAFRLSAVYVLVMAATYAAAGVLVALSGQNVQIWFQNPILLSVFAVLFVLFALSMFGLFELQMPRFIQNRLTNAANAQRGGGYRGVITMGFLSTLIVGPCITAPLAGALIFIADTGNAVTGGAALFALGLGMGVPLLLVGTSAGSLVPSTGVWMVRVKQGFGVLMLAMAIWMLSRFLPVETIVVLAGLLALASGIWLGATDRLDAGSGGWPRLAKGAGLAVCLYGVALLAGALAGGGSLLRPLAVFTGGGDATTEAHLTFERVETVAELDRVVAEASASGRTVMLDFYADWCISCKEMEAFTFTDPGVQTLLDRVVLLQVDVTENDAADKAFLERFGLFAPPAILFFDPAGRELSAARVVGFMPARTFSEHLGRVLASVVAQRDV